MTALFWVPYVLNRMAMNGLSGTLAGGRRQQQAFRSGLSVRSGLTPMRSNLAIFAPVVLTAHVLGISNAATKAAVVVYFFARLLHFAVYSAGVPAARTLAFTAGWLAQIAIIASILRWI